MPYVESLLKRAQNCIFKILRTYKNYRIVILGQRNTNKHFRYLKLKVFIQTLIIVYRLTTEILIVMTNKNINKAVVFIGTER